jgi:hypothetical protein
MDVTGRRIVVAAVVGTVAVTVGIGALAFSRPSGVVGDGGPGSTGTGPGSTGTAAVVPGGPADTSGAAAAPDGPGPTGPDAGPASPPPPTADVSPSACPADVTVPRPVDDRTAEVTAGVRGALVGCAEGTATARAGAVGWTVRVVKRDGEDYVATDDFRPDRLDLAVDRGVITAVDVG